MYNKKKSNFFNYTFLNIFKLINLEFLFKLYNKIYIYKLFRLNHYILTSD